MALHELTEDGNMKWLCPKCGSERTAHHSHNLVYWYGKMPAKPEDHTIALPPCECGRQVFLKAHFTAEELAGTNMIDPTTGAMTASHATAHRHMKLAKQMIAAGKLPGGSET